MIRHHYVLFDDLIDAVLAYVSDSDNGISRVVVSGHSLGGVMADSIHSALSESRSTAVDARHFAAIPGVELLIISIASSGIDELLFTDTSGSSFLNENYDYSVAGNPGDFSLTTPSNFYVGFAHDEDNVAYPSLGFIPSIPLRGRHHFDTVSISLRNIDNDDIGSVFGAEHNMAIYWHNIQ